MANTTNEEKLLSHLTVCSNLIDAMRRVIIEAAGRESRPYSDKEEWCLARLEDAKYFVGNAQFAAQRLNFNMEHEI